MLTNQKSVAAPRSQLGVCRRVTWSTVRTFGRTTGAGRRMGGTRLGPSRHRAIQCRPPSHWSGNNPGSEPPLDPQPKTTVARDQTTGRGSADLRDRSAGFASKETRANGQPRDMDRQGTLRWEHNPIYCSTFSCSTLWAPGRWAFVRKHPIRCADKSPWIGQETPLDSSRIPPSSLERHPSKPCPEGTFFHCPGFVRSTTLGDRTNRSHQP